MTINGAAAVPTDAEQTIVLDSVAKWRRYPPSVTANEKTDCDCWRKEAQCADRITLDPGDADVDSKVQKGGIAIESDFTTAEKVLQRLAWHSVFAAPSPNDSL